MTWRTPKYTGPERRRVKRWRPRPLRLLVFLLAVLAIGYTVGVLSLVSEESTLVFEAGRTFGDLRPSFPYTQIDLPRRDGVHQFAWIMPRDIGDEGIWALYLHGNASTIASSVNISHYRELRRVGLSVLAPEYRGFAGLAGQPTEGALDADARAAYDYLRTERHIAPERIVVFGWSLGSALAVDLAQSVEQAAVILEGAPTSQAGLTQRRYPFFPVRLLIRNPFDSRGKIAGVRSPLLFLHATDDQVVPIAEGRRLFDAARGDKTFVEVRGGHFGAVDVDASAFSQAIRRFLDAHGLTARRPARNGA